MRVLLILAVATMFLTACSSTEKKETQKMDTNDVSKVYRMYEWPAEISFDLTVGNSERFILGENGTTGYLWNAEFDETVCKVTLERLPPEEKDEMLCGAPGEVMVSIEPLCAGESDITLKYMRSWEPNDPAHVIKIHVVGK